MDSSNTKASNKNATATRRLVINKKKSSNSRERLKTWLNCSTVRPTPRRCRDRFVFETYKKSAPSHSGRGRYKISSLDHMLKDIAAMKKLSLVSKTKNVIRAKNFSISAESLRARASKTNATDLLFLSIFIIN